MECTEAGFVLKDLNSKTGTYVNDCRIQNASVRLVNGDLLKFGGTGHIYQLYVENTPVCVFDVAQKNVRDLFVMLFRSLSDLGDK